MEIYTSGEGIFDFFSPLSHTHIKQYTSTSKKYKNIFILIDHLFKSLLPILEVKKI